MALGTGKTVEVEIKGLDELEKTLEEMPYKIAKRGLRQSLRAGADVLRNEIIALAPKDTGFMSEHFGTKIKVQRGELAATAYIGPQGKVDYPAFMSGAYRIVRSAKGKAKKVGRVAVATVVRFLEFGTSKMAKKPFMTAAFDSRHQDILNAIVEKLRDACAP
jgi:HK97 gp10 family phage protein